MPIFTPNYPTPRLLLPPHPHHTICLLLNSCSLLCHLCPTPLPLLQPLLAVAASLSSVYFLACCIATAQQLAPEPPQSALLRKQVQAENWRLMLNRALYLAQMQAVLARRRASRGKREVQVIVRTNSAPHEEKKSRAAMRRWQSWSETHSQSSIPDFHAEDCRNTDWQTMS
jgi:endonuclease/exonuclease/phosphatase (EEP) superfamily protein YafD